MSNKRNAFLGALHNAFHGASQITRFLVHLKTRFYVTSYVSCTNISFIFRTATNVRHYYIKAFFQSTADILLIFFQESCIILGFEIHCLFLSCRSLKAPLLIYSLLSNGDFSPTEVIKFLFYSGNFDKKNVQFFDIFFRFAFGHLRRPIFIRSGLRKWSKKSSQNG